MRVRCWSDSTLLLGGCLLVDGIPGALLAFSVRSEKGCTSALGGGCRVPIGALARVEGDALHLQARVSKPDGSRMFEASESGPVHSGERVVASVAERLLASGAGSRLAAAAA